MFFEMMTIREYSELAGYSTTSTRVHQIIRSGIYPVEWIKPPQKIGNQWILFVNSEFVKRKQQNND